MGKLSQRSWDQILRVVLLKMQDAGAPATTNPDTIMGFMRDNWELLCDRDAVVAYLSRRELVAKRAERVAALARAKVLAAEIEKLKG